jgi:hypothetical protein
MSRLKIKSQGLCAFCGRPGVSKEHVWPEWTHAFLSRDAPATNVRASYAIDVGESPGVSLEDRRRRQGDVKTLKVRVVCREHCNGGWMSRLETAATPILKPLLTGQPIHLGQQEQRTTAAWIAKTVMMLEFGDHRRISTSPAQRRFLMDFGEPPTGWKIWIAQYHGEDWKSKAARISAALEIFGDGVRTIDKGRRPAMNTQAITFGIGRLLVQVIATSLPFVMFDIDPKFEPYTPQLWPFRSALGWPTAHVLNDADAVELMNGLGRMLRNDPNHIDALVS